MAQRAARQRHIALILAKDLAAQVATPMLLVDEVGDLVFFNEPAEAILGRPYAEAQMSRADLAKMFKPVDEAGQPVPIQNLPLSQAIRTGTATHGSLTIEAVDGTRRDLDVMGIPLLARVGQPVGGLAIFWERSGEG
jgi:PAS domain-containing protein